MRILLANSTAYPHQGGVENSLAFMARELILAGHEVKIFCFQLSPDEPLQMIHEGVEIIRYPLKSSRWPHRQHMNRVASVKTAMASVLQEFNPDAVWSRAATVGVGILRAGYKGTLLQIFPTNARMNCRGAFLQTQGLPVRRRLMLLGLWPSAYFVSAHFERELTRRCKAVTFSENMRRQVLTEGGKNCLSCQVIKPGVDSEMFSPVNGARYFNEIEREYGLNRSEPIVLYVGRLSCAKHIPLLMDAVLALKSKAKLVVVGNGPEEARLNDYACRIGLGGRVVFAGAHREMLPGFYAMSRVCVLPTTIESFGQVYLESLASGTPAVGFAGDGRRVLTATDEIIRDGKTGGVVSKVSARALAEKVDAIISLDDKEYAAMSRRAVVDARIRFSWKQFVTEALACTLGDLDVRGGAEECQA
ncbi:glycosyltransferase family 4 protein [Desulfoluna spongiiphila]|uniref:glycosyltransferase family 4 protein n=1 Tax=Desulfoluna spongiiphila TaxID=419481 RepID=UPI001252080A|nr:glycosyltransferase [Desulfoluna spongiiphila]VVS94861.1 glycosyl transferase family 1 [Desulfoluna spongiiphila]